MGTYGRASSQAQAEEEAASEHYAVAGDCEHLESLHIHNARLALNVTLLREVLQWPCTSIALSGWLFAASVQLLAGQSDLLVVGNVSELAMLDTNSTCAAVA